MCYGMSTGAVWWLDYEMLEKNNIKDNAGEIKNVKKGENVLFCLTVYYPSLHIDSAKA